MAKKVLICYATGGMGHVTAARAVEQAFKVKYPQVEVQNVDVIDYASLIYRKVFVDGYNFVSAKRPEVWGWLYKQFNRRSNQKLPTILSRLAIEGKFIPMVKKFNPDFIVATHPLPMVLVSASKRKEVINIMSSMVVTDFGCHSFWVDSEVDYYFVATDQVAAGLEDYGVKPNQVAVTGIPIELKFSQGQDKSKLVEKFGLNPDLSTLLVVGGQFSFTALKTIINGIKKSNQDIQFIVVAGRDQELKKSLEKSNLTHDSRIKVFGFVQNMEELMTVSDLIFSKAGGLTVSECMAKGLPMVINKVIPGQEEDNVDYLVKQGAAIKVVGFVSIVKAVNEVLVQPKKLELMKQACHKIGKPNSATALADFVYKQISQ